MPLHVGDFGSSFRTSFVVPSTGRGGCSALDLTGATVTFRFRRPDGTTEDKLAVVSNARKGIAEYVAEDGFLDQVGGWVWQPLVATSEGQWYGAEEQFTVEAHLDDPT